MAEPFFATRTLHAIEVLVFRPSSARQVASELRIDARTARRLLNRLVDDGWATRIEGRERIYVPTLRIVALAAHLIERASLVRAARPVVAALNGSTGAAAQLEIPSYRSALAVVRHDDTSRLAPAHADAGGKMLLACRDAWRESVLERPLERLTAATVVDPDDLRAECGRIRQEQVAFEYEERREGRFAMAAPIHDADGTVPAALVLTGDHPFGLDDPRRSALEDAAQELSAVLREAA